MKTIRCLHLSFAVCLSLVFAIGQAAGEEASSPKEKELVGVLQSGTPQEKALACKQLAIHGGKAAVPELAKLLSDEQLASWARIALEAIPDPSAGEALCQASQSLKGKLLVGVINSIGMRRDAAACELLAARLQDQDADVASAAAVALGRIGDNAAVKALRPALAAGPAVRNAAAEGCVLCAERLLHEGKLDQAAALYDEVRQAELPKQRRLEATRGAILARKSQGIPLLVEQLRAEDRAFFQLGLTVARELPGADVAEAVAAELNRATPQRGALLLSALADRNDAAIPAAVLEAAQSAPKPVRVAAIGYLGRRGNEKHLDLLLEIAASEDADAAASARAALAALPGEGVNAAVVARLQNARDKTLPALLAVVGTRRINATAHLIKAVDHADPAVRAAALAALGETATPKELPVLIAQVVAPARPGDSQAAIRALKAASVRMPDREACSAELASALPRAAAETKVQLLEILAAVGGNSALQTIAAAVRGSDETLQDAGSRLLGEWMSVDAGPVLLDLAKTSSSDKYRVRALRGYIRLARQFDMPAKQRAEMCQAALDAAQRAEEQNLVLAVLERYPSTETLRVAVKAAETPNLKNGATRTVLAIVQKMGNSPEARAAVAKVLSGAVKVEIIKATYGAGAQQKDVTDIIKKHVGSTQWIALPANFNEAFGGDPAPGVKKELKIEYKLDGKSGQATFPENALIVLPAPK